MNKTEYLTRLAQEKADLEIDPSLQADDIWCCMECGSIDIEYKVWCGMNTGQVTDSCEEDTCYCNECEEVQPYEYLPKFLEGLKDD